MARARKAQNVIGIMLPGNSMTVGIKHVHDQAIRQNIDGSFLLASELSNAKDIPVILVIQGWSRNDKWQPIRRKLRCLAH
jgi:hypothetical protein